MEIYGMSFEEAFNYGVAYLGVNVGLILGFMIYIVRLKLKEIKTSEMINQILSKANVQANEEALKQIDNFQQKISVELAALQKSMYLKIDENEEARQMIVDEKAQELQTALEEFKSSNANIDEEIEKIMKGE